MFCASTFFCVILSEYYKFTSQNDMKIAFV